MACACCTCSPALRRPRERPLPYLNQNPGRPMEKNGLYYRVSYLGLYRVKQGTILMETVYDSCSIHVECISIVKLFTPSTNEGNAFSMCRLTNGLKSIGTSWKEFRAAWIQTVQHLLKPRSGLKTPSASTKPPST